MMRRWLICFSFGASLALIGANGSTVSGAIQLIPNSKSPRGQTRHLSDIVVWLESPVATVSFGVPARHAQMLQEDKMFHPHVLPILVGTAVEFPNADPIFHNAFSNYDGQMFDVALYPPGTSRTVVFRKAGIVRVFCNIHPSMSAIILVLKNPYFARVAADGRYRIANVPPGQYELHYYDERAATDDTHAPQLTVESALPEVSAPTLHVSEASYVTLPPHRNKYGQDYPPDAGSYGGDIGPPK
jgi:plastocyanin